MVGPVDAQSDPDQYRDSHDHKDSDIVSCPSSPENVVDFLPVYRVVAPCSELVNFKAAIKETLLPDNPFYQFKDQPRLEKSN